LIGLLHHWVYYIFANAAAYLQRAVATKLQHSAAKLITKLSFCISHHSPWLNRRIGPQIFTGSVVNTACKYPTPDIKPHVMDWGSIQ
jgi:hypothetical protein